MTRCSLRRILRVIAAVFMLGCFSFFLRVFQAVGFYSSILPNQSPWSPLERYFNRPNATDNVIVNPHPFRRILHPGYRVCASDDVFLLIYVHSAAQNFDRRQIIRNSWGNVTQFTKPVRLVFVMGLPAGTNASISQSIAEEFDRHGDLVQENFIDTYYNITYKAVAALKWVRDYCPRANFVLKTDDDAFVNTFMVIELLSRMSKAEPAINRRSILCNLWFDDVPRTGKWALSTKDFRYEKYPSFCQGLAYILSGDLVELLYNATYYVPFLKMDDVYLTGFVPLRVSGFRHVELNSYYVKSLFLWKKFATSSGWMNSVFSHVSDVTDIEPLWRILTKFANTYNLQANYNLSFTIR